MKVKKTGAGYEMSEEEWIVYRRDVYEYLFYNDRKWGFEGQSVFFNGSLIHYSDFMKARRGNL